MKAGATCTAHLEFLVALSERPVHGPAAALQLDSLSLLGFQLCLEPEDLSPRLGLADPLRFLTFSLEPLLLQACLHTLMGT